MGGMLVAFSAHISNFDFSKFSLLPRKGQGAPLMTLREKKSAGLESLLLGPPKNS